jgi:class 3 adenylate cyclase
MPSPGILWWNAVTRAPSASVYSSLIDGDMLKRGVDRLREPTRRTLHFLLPRLLSAAWKCSHAKATATRSACFGNSAVSETRKLAAILVSDVVGYSRLTGTDEDWILAPLRGAWGDRG